MEKENKIFVCFGDPRNGEIVEVPKEKICEIIKAAIDSFYEGWTQQNAIDEEYYAISGRKQPYDVWLEKQKKNWLRKAAKDPLNIAAWLLEKEQSTFEDWLKKKRLTESHGRREGLSEKEIAAELLQIMVDP